MKRTSSTTGPLGLGLVLVCVFVLGFVHSVMESSSLGLPALYICFSDVLWCPQCRKMAGFRILHGPRGEIDTDSSHVLRLYDKASLHGRSVKLSMEVDFHENFLTTQIKVQHRNRQASLAKIRSFSFSESSRSSYATNSCGCALRRCSFISIHVVWAALANSWDKIIINRKPRIITSISVVPASTITSKHLPTSAIWSLYCEGSSEPRTWRPSHRGKRSGTCLEFNTRGEIITSVWVKWSTTWQYENCKEILIDFCKF